ncbi:MAG: hypothetical protein HQL82_01155 [Magnetococcales bacterium]|nr:hypothetical protein [Magnetococcales bacterium]
MYAVEIETSIIDHRLTAHSNRLPANAPHVKVIVLVEEGADDPEFDILALAHAAQASFPKVDLATLRQEFTAMRDEWDAGERHY